MILKPFLAVLFLEIFPLAVLYMLVTVFRHKKKGKRSPLTRDLLRSPGQSLRDKIDDMQARRGRGVPRDMADGAKKIVELAK